MRRRERNVYDGKEDTLIKLTSELGNLSVPVVEVDINMSTAFADIACLEEGELKRYTDGLKGANHSGERAPVTFRLSKH